MEAAGYTPLPHKAGTNDVTGLGCNSCKRLRSIRALPSISGYHMQATVALATVLFFTVSYVFSDTVQYSTDESVNKWLTNGVDDFLDRAHKLSPLPHAGLDNTTLGKPGKVVFSRQASSLSAPDSRLPSPSFRFPAHSSLLPQATPHFTPSDIASPSSVWAAPRRDTKVRGSLDMSIPTMLEDDGVGIKGRWKEVTGNFVIYPQNVESNPPRGIIHFLGGAFVGAAPHLTYRYLLDSLCDSGYIVVTTPYRLDFNYIETCKGILSRFDFVSAELTAQFGALPVIGVGHSCGALLQTLITSEFPDRNRSENVLISFNNKPAKEAIPNFDDAVVPVSQLVMQDDNAAGAREAIATARSVFDGLLQGVGTSDLAPPIVKNELVPVVKQSLEVVDQIPDLLASIAAGTREFTPSPERTREIVRDMYRANRTLLIQFESDAIDESPEISRVLRDATQQASVNSTMKMEVELKELGGTHVTPLTQNVFLDPPALEFQGQTVQDPLSPLRQQVRENFLQTVNEVKTLIVQWLAQK